MRLFYAVIVNLPDNENGMSLTVRWILPKENRNKIKTDHI